MKKDWTGNTLSVYSQLGARNYAKEERETNDYYATDPKAVELLCRLEKFSPVIWEPACGEGHISKVLESHGYKVYSSDLIDRGYGEVLDFLTCSTPPENGCDIVTNPPYKYAKEFVEHALDLIDDGHKIAMFLKIQFLEGKARRELFKRYPPKTVWVSSGRLGCGKNGDFESHSQSACCFCWFIWEKGYSKDTIIKWFN